MKQKLYFLLSFFWISLISIGQTLDQSNAPSGIGGGGFTVSSSVNVGQSFTAGLTGNLSQVNVRLGDYSSFTAGDFQIRIYDGEGYGGTLLNTTVFNVSSLPSFDYAEIVVPLSSTPAITAGNKYTIDLRGITGAASGHGTGGGGGPYTAGLFYANQSPFSAYSLWFKTFVNLPTPATHLNFDGVDDFVNLGTTTSSSLNNSNFLSVEAWIKVPNVVGIKTIVGNHGSGTQFNLRVVDNTLNAFLGFGAYGVSSPLGAIVANTWTHVSMVYDDTTLKIYINGVVVGSTSVPLGYSLANTSPQTFIGKSGFVGEIFQGDIDEVRVWNKVLNATDILNTMNCELQASETGLVAYYKFNQGNDSVNNASVTTLLDSSGNANNGTLTNFALTGTSSNWRSGSTVTTGNICATLGNSDFENIAKIFIYPNPSTGVFNIVSQQDMVVEIYDMLGKLVLNQNVSIGTGSVDISNFSSGVYLLKAFGAEGSSASYKLIKK